MAVLTKGRPEHEEAGTDDNVAQQQDEPFHVVGSSVLSQAKDRRSYISAEL